MAKMKAEKRNFESTIKFAQKGHQLFMILFADQIIEVFDQPDIGANNLYMVIPDL